MHIVAIALFIIGALFFAAPLTADDRYPMPIQTLLVMWVFGAALIGCGVVVWKAADERKQEREMRRQEDMFRRQAEILREAMRDQSKD